MMACQSSSATPFYVAPNFENEDGSAKRLPNHWSILLVKCLIYQFFVSVSIARSAGHPWVSPSAKRCNKKNSFNTPETRDSFINRYLFENRRRGLLQITRNTHHQTAREQSYIHVEKTVAKSVSTSMITDDALRIPDPAFE